MKQLVLRILLSLALRLMLNNTRVQDLLGKVEHINSETVDTAEKQKLVTESLRDREGWSMSTAELNMVTEMGVNLYRIIAAKKK